MLARAQSEGAQSGDAGGLVVPVVIHDGQDIPEKLQAIQSLPLQTLSNPRMTKDSATGEELSEKIRAWVPDVKLAIESAPQWHQEWVGLATEDFQNLFKARQRKARVPSLGGPS